MWRKTFSIFIDAPPRRVFDHVSDLTRHGEWSPTPLSIEPLSAGRVGVGSRYRSVGYTRGQKVTSEVEVTVYEPPTRFAFVATSPSTVFRHEFRFAPRDGGTFVERTVTRLKAIPKVKLIGPLFHRLVLVPANQDSMSRLRTRVEEDERR